MSKVAALTKSTELVTVALTVAPDPDLDMVAPYSGKPVRPVGLVLSYAWGTGSQGWRVEKVTVSGVVLDPDTREARPWAPKLNINMVSSKTGRIEDAAPPWVVLAAAEHFPSAVAS